MAWYYYAGGAAGIAGLYLIARGAQGRAANDEPAANEPAAMAMQPPLFVSPGGVGGGGGGVGDQTLAGNSWQPTTIPIADNPDVAIAKINADVNLAAINAAAKLQEAAIVTANPPANTTSSRTEYRGSNIAEGAAFVSTKLAEASSKGYAAVENEIFSAAKGAGFSATEVAQSYKAATGKNVTPAEVNKWLSDRGLSL